MANKPYGALFTVPCLCGCLLVCMRSRECVFVYVFVCKIETELGERGGV